MARVLHRPVAAHRTGEQVHVHRQAAEVVADLDAPLLAPPAATSPCQVISVPSTGTCPAGPRGPAVAGRSAPPPGHARDRSSSVPGRPPGPLPTARRCAR